MNNFDHENFEPKHPPEENKEEPIKDIPIPEYHDIQESERGKYDKEKEIRD
jgi:hypothetical protein